MSDLENIIPNQAKALLLARKQLPELVYDAVQLEGIDYSLTEVIALIAGLPVSGHKLSDETITLNQVAAWKQLFAWVEHNEFNLSKKRACELHAIASKYESLKWREFRTGGVTIAGTDYLPPPAKQLDQLWDEMCHQAKKITDIYQQAIFVFLQMARNQFFYDTNKRMGRFLWHIVTTRLSRYQSTSETTNGIQSIDDRFL